MAVNAPPEPSGHPAGLMGRPPAAKSKGLFGKPAAASDTASPELSAISEGLNQVSRRLRMIEDRYTNMRKKLQLIERNMLTNQKKIIIEVKIVDSEIKDMKHSLLEMQGRILMIIKELKSSAKKQDVDVLNKYISLWEPVKFVTANQVERMIREILEEHRR